MSEEIFINYRSPDTHSYAILLYLELSRRFGPELVFLDSESIPAGADFGEQLVHRVRGARAVLALIGPTWLSMTKPRWRLQIRPSSDWACRELIEALAVGVPVIPVLTDHARIPAERDLPTGLTKLDRCQYRRLRCRDFRADLDRITNDLIALGAQLRAVATPASMPKTQRHGLTRPRVSQVVPWSDPDHYPLMPNRPRK